MIELQRYARQIDNFEREQLFVCVLLQMSIVFCTIVKHLVKFSENTIQAQFTINILNQYQF